MTVVEPWVESQSDREAIQSLLKSLVGTSLSSVEYLLPGSSSRSTIERCEGVEIADMGVCLRREGAPDLIAFWVMKGAREGLALASGTSSEDATGRRLRPLNASDSFDLKAATRRISGVAVAWHRPDGSGVEALWSMRLGFETGENVTFALGEWDDEGFELRYQPDNVVVIFDRNRAMGFRSPGAIESAWGLVI